MIIVPAVFQPLATAVSEAPGCSVAPAAGEVIAACVSVTAIAAEETAAVVTTTPALASVPDAADAATKLPWACAVNWMW